jgi:inositol oxygenase
MAPDAPSNYMDIQTNADTKTLEDFRTYTQDEDTPARVVEHYRDMRQYQTVEFYQRMEKKYSFENGAYRKLMTIEEAFVELENYIDASDPDLDLPNLLHLLQTAEGIRKANHPDWLQLTGLLHDMGKIMFLWGTGEDGQDGYSPNGKQWALGGDTFVVGCRIPAEAVVFPEFNELNPDMHDERYNTDYGIYKPNCGLDELKFAWGHDEYMYRMLVANDSKLPREALDMIRYHSAYPWHDKGAYQHLMKNEDYERMKWVQLFNKFDLYTKDGDNELRGDKMKDLWPYYKGLLEKYGLDGKLKW